MPKLDRQHRLTIPDSIRKELSWNFPTTIALCYDFYENQILVCKKDFCNDLSVIDFRRIDSKGRIAFSKECINLLKATTDDMFVIFLKNGKLFVKKA